MPYLVTGAGLSVTLLGIVSDHALISRVLPVAGQVPFFSLLYAAASHMSEGKSFLLSLPSLGHAKVSSWGELRFAPCRQEEAAKGKLCPYRAALNTF